MIILGIDPGTADTGWGVIKTNSQGLNKVVDWGSIKTPAKLFLPQRLEIIFNDLSKIIEEFNPKVVSVEKLFFFKNQKTVISVAEARGVVLLVASQKELPVYNFTPMEIKMGITGYGRADKSQMQKMIKELLCLKETPKPDDAADALGAAICCSLFLRKKQKTEG